MTTDVYESLIKWLEKSWYGVAESEHLRPLLKSFYSPEELMVKSTFDSCYTKSKVKRRLNSQSFIKNCPAPNTADDNVMQCARHIDASFAWHSALLSKDFKYVNM